MNHGWKDVTNLSFFKVLMVLSHAPSNMLSGKQTNIKREMYSESTFWLFFFIMLPWKIVKYSAFKSFNYNNFFRISHKLSIHRLLISSWFLFLSQRIFKLNMKTLWRDCSFFFILSFFWFLFRLIIVFILSHFSACFYCKSYSKKKMWKWTIMR